MEKIGWWEEREEKKSEDFLELAGLSEGESEEEKKRHSLEKNDAQSWLITNKNQNMMRTTRQ